MTMIYKTTGSKRISVVIQDSKEKYLVVKTDGDERNLEFPGFSESGYELKEQGREALINARFDDILGISLEDLSLIEIFTEEEYPLGHYIFTGKIQNGIPTKKKYKNLYWKRLDEVNGNQLNIYGLQVYQKLSECAYCRSMAKNKERLDEFFDRFMGHDAAVLVTEAVDESFGNNAVSKVCTRYYLSHLRAVMVEDENRKKNSTIQNYLKHYKREDLAEEVDNLLHIQIAEGMVLKDLIKTVVDRQIAHYDHVAPEEKRFREQLENLFLSDGPVPLTKFVQYIESYLFSLIVETWFYAGELGVKISDTGLDFAVYQDMNRKELLHNIQMLFVKEEIE